MPGKEILDLGVVGIALILLWKGLDIIRIQLTAKKLTSYDGIPLMSPLACQIDPQHFAHVLEAHGMLLEMKESIDAGQFNCVWKGRDEVRDFMELSKQSLSLMQTMVDEIKGLRRDLVHARIQRVQQGEAGDG